MTDGQMIELPVFPNGSDTETLVSADEARALRRASGLPGVEITCPECGSDLVYPLDWEATSAPFWLVTTRCPECDSEHDRPMQRWLVERFVAQLHRQKRALGDDLARLSLGSFCDEVERFVAALQAGHIQPMDF